MRKKNLITALKKLVASFGGEGKGNNAVDLVDELADVATQGGGGGRTIMITTDTSPVAGLGSYLAKTEASDPMAPGLPPVSYNDLREWLAQGKQVLLVSGILDVDPSTTGEWTVYRLLTLKRSIVNSSLSMSATFVAGGNQTKTFTSSSDDAAMYHQIGGESISM